MKPRDYLELFEFLKYSRTKSVLKEMALATARAGMGDG